MSLYVKSSTHGPQWEREEEYRQSVIRKAVLLGFSAEQYVNIKVGAGDDFRGEIVRWQFTLEGKNYGAYMSLYSAAYDYLRLLKCEHLAGEYRG